MFKSGCSGCFSIIIKIALVVILYLRVSALLEKSDNLYGEFESIIDPEVVNEVKLEDQGFLLYFEFIQLPFFDPFEKLDLEALTQYFGSNVRYHW